MADEQHHPPDRPDSDGSSSCDSEEFADFEKVSIPCSESLSDERTSKDLRVSSVLPLSTKAHHAPQELSDSLSAARTSSRLSPSLPADVYHKPEEHSCSGSAAQTSDSGGPQSEPVACGSSLSSFLCHIAYEVERLEAAEVEPEIERRMRSEREEMRLERETWQRREAAYKKRIAVLEAKNERISDRTKQDRCENCELQERQVEMLRQEAAHTRAQKRELEDELHTLKAQFSALRASQKSRQSEAEVCIPRTERSPTSAFASCLVSEASGNDEWACPHCTLINLPSADVCDACGSPRTPGRSRGTLETD